MGSHNASASPPQIAYETEVLVAGGGPVGMLMAYQLARSGVPCMMVEQGTRTTAHPKMEFFSPRSMEIFKQIGLADSMRALGVPEHYPFNEIFSTGLSRKDGCLHTMKRESPAEFREKWKKDNSGSHPQEPYMRISQILVEAWLKPVCAAERLIDDRWGWTMDTLAEKDDHVLSTVVVDEWGKKVVIKSKFVVGCDGAGSRVRYATGLEAKRKPLPLNMYMVHFRSFDLETLYAQGGFWHLNFMSGSIMINQDEKEIFTFHTMVGPDVEAEDMDAMKTLQAGLGGIGEPCPIKVEQILKTAVWRSSVSVADAFRSTKGRVFLAGDSAHQLTPVGGNGLNSGIADTFDLTWKLASVLRGYGQEHLLASYDHERRPVAKTNVKRVEEGMGFFLPLFQYAATVGHDVIHAQDEAGAKARANLKDMIDGAHWVHSQEGNWVDYRYRHSPVVVDDPTSSEPPYRVTKYTPSTWPGMRAPHVFLSNGMTSIFELYGPDFSLVDFTRHGEVSALFAAVAKGMGIPVKCICLPFEPHARSVWERDAVLLRPDGHVAWRSPPDVGLCSVAAVRHALAVATGRERSANYRVLPELQEDMFVQVPPEERLQQKNELLGEEKKTGTVEQLKGDKLDPSQSPSGIIPEVQAKLAETSMTGPSASAASASNGA